MGKAAKRKWARRFKLPEHLHSRFSAAKFMRRLVNANGGRSVLLGVDTVTYQMHRSSDAAGQGGK